MCVEKNNKLKFEDYKQEQQFYVNSNVNGIHTPSTNIVELKYLDMLHLMRSYSEYMLENYIINISNDFYCFNDIPEEQEKCEKQCDNCKNA